MGMKKRNQKAETEEEGRSGKEAVVNWEERELRAGLAIEVPDVWWIGCSLSTPVISQCHKARPALTFHPDLPAPP